MWTDSATAVVQSSESVAIPPDCAQPSHNRARRAPSWVPDLNNGSVPSLFEQDRRGLSKIHPSLRVDGNTLVVQEICLDRIDGLTATRCKFDNFSMNTDTERRLIQPESALRKE